MSETVLHLYALVVPDTYPVRMSYGAHRVSEVATDAGEESAVAYLLSQNCGDEPLVGVVFGVDRLYALPGVLIFEGRVTVQTPARLSDPHYAEVVRRLVRGMVLTDAGPASAVYVSGARLQAPSADRFEDYSGSVTPLQPAAESLLTGPLLPA